MIKVKRIHIKRFRSIVDLELKINTDNNLITICGENNAGKTNTLRALDLFFNPSKYDPSKDAPHHKFEGSRGASVYPHITVDFLLPNNDVYTVIKKFKLEGLEKIEGSNLTTHGNLTSKEIEALEKKISFFFVESINVDFPTIINNLVDDLYDIEYGDAQFRGIKSDLKKSFESYTTGLLSILQKLSEEINPVFREFKENWGIDFDLDIDIKKFRDLITDDIKFYISDGSNQLIEAKGSGLQRLAYILLHFRIAEKISSKSVMLLIDEPDVYLHQGLQKKLLNHLLKLQSNSQIFITTHSPVFIDSYRLNNVFLLDLNIEKKQYKRRNKSFNVLSTKLVNIDEYDGAKKIRNYLGIEELDYSLLDKYNIIVEGETDANYLSELCKYFKLDMPKMLWANGADNISKYIEFYNSFYQSSELEVKPFVLILLDNDNKGREIYQKVVSEKGKVNNIGIDVKLLPNYLGEAPTGDNLAKITTDHQIEDFIYPSLFCYLVNELLKKRNFKTIDSRTVCLKIEKPAFKSRGILFVCENEKNDRNPDEGHKLNFIGSNGTSEGIKKGFAGLFRIQGNSKIGNLIEMGNSTYPEVRKFLEMICDPKLVCKP